MQDIFNREVLQIWRRLFFSTSGWYKYIDQKTNQHEVRINISEDEVQGLNSEIKKLKL